nr:MAG TPA: hypothetical protein [Caudoviricetes sp.]
MSFVAIKKEPHINARFLITYKTSALLRRSFLNKNNLL